VVLVAISMPIAFSLGGACVVAILFFGDLPLAAVPHKLVNGINSFVFLAIPLFLLAGRLMNVGGITERIFYFARVLVGHIHGGLAHANVVASMIFAWMSGSAVAAVGGLGEIEIKAMKENGYDVPFAAAVGTAASTIGPVIPPSIPLIIYGAMTEKSVGRLFLGGIVPGVLLGVSLMVLIWFLSKRRGYPKDDFPGFGELWKASKDAAVPLLMPVIILGGIMSGYFTPTEAAAIAAVYALLVSMFFYRSVKLKHLPKILAETMVTTAVVTFIISCTQSFSFLLVVENAGDKIGELVLGLTENKYAILLMVNVILLFFGALMEAGVVLILFTPILVPIMTQVGVDPIHFGVIMCVNLMIGVATPPVGVCLFVMSHISGVRVERLMKEIIPFLIPLFLILLLITYFPAIVMWIPNMFMKV
jgi:tripartite ATP-independent transporter DctM subunit